MSEAVQYALDDDVFFDWLYAFSIKPSFEGLENAATLSSPPELDESRICLGVAALLAQPQIALDRLLIDGVIFDLLSKPTSRLLKVKRLAAESLSSIEEDSELRDAQADARSIEALVAVVVELIKGLDL